MKKILKKDVDFKCISLESRTDRRDWVTSHLPKYGIKFSFFDAVSDPTLYKNFSFSEKMKHGNRGCFLSHYEILKNHQSNKIIGVFEDDVILCEDFEERFNYIEKNFNLDWDIFFLSSFYHLNNDKRRWHSTGDYELTDIKYIHRVYGAFTTHAYLVNPHSKEKILKMMEEYLPKSYAVDHLYILIQKQLNCYSFTPGLANQIISISDIDGVMKDQNIFSSVVGKHYFANSLGDFDYENYFKK